MQHIATVPVGSGGAASITFSAIPDTFTDLLLVSSLRLTDDTVVGGIRLNGDTGSNFTVRRLEGNGSSASSGVTTATSFTTRFAAATSYTSNTFSSHSFYLPNYLSSVAKSVSIDTSIENNATAGPNLIEAGLWTGTAAVTSITLLLSSGNFVEFSSASLYGILAGSDGIVSVS